MSLFLERTARLPCVLFLLLTWRRLFSFCNASLEVIRDEDLPEEQQRQEYRLRDALATLDVYLHPQIQLRQSKQYGGWYVQVVKQTDNVGNQAASTTTMMIPRDTVLMHVPEQAQLGPHSALCRPPYVVDNKASTALYDVLPSIGATALCLLHHLARVNQHNHDAALTTYLDLLPPAGTPNVAYFSSQTLWASSQYQPFIHAAGAVVQDVHDMMETVERYCRQQQWHHASVVREEKNTVHWQEDGDDDEQECNGENEKIHADETSANDIAISLQECLGLGDPSSVHPINNDAVRALLRKSISLVLSRAFTKATAHQVQQLIMAQQEENPFTVQQQQPAAANNLAATIGEHFPVVMVPFDFLITTRNAKTSTVSFWKTAPCSARHSVTCNLVRNYSFPTGPP